MAIIDRRGVTVDATDTIIAGDPNPGLAIKAAVRAATTGDITLSGLQTIDGIALAAGDRVLVKDQADATQNGIYTASSGPWSRSVDAASNSQWASGTQVLVASGGMYAQRLPADDPDYRQGRYQGTTAYARSKRMQVALAPVLQERWGGDGVTVLAMHPGWADTPGVASSLPAFRKITRPLLRDADAGADTVVWLSETDHPLPGGTFWHDRAERPTHYLPSTRETPQERDRLWSWVRDATGLVER